MQIVALLRGVTPVGKNKIPKMSALVELLEKEGFQQVKSYIQSGNIILDTESSHEEVSKKIHDVIKENIGADLSVIIKTKEDLKIALTENPFDDSYDYSRIHLVFTNDAIDEIKLEEVRHTMFFPEIFQEGTSCMYLFLPREAPKKKLNTNFLEKKLGITGTMRKANVIQHLFDMMDDAD